MFNENVVWRGTLDGRWEVSVARPLPNEKPDEGWLMMVDVATGEYYREPVDTSQLVGSRWEVDGADVCLWCKIAERLLLTPPKVLP